MKSGANYGNEQGDCSLIDSSMQDLLNTIFTWISIIGIILVVVLSAILDGVKAIVGTDDGFRDFVKRFKDKDNMFNRFITCADNCYVCSTNY